MPADVPLPAIVAATPAASVAQLAGQRIVFPFEGRTVPAALRARISRGEAGAVILFARNVRSVSQVRRLTRELQAIPRPAGLDEPLLVMVDQEGGLVRRLPGSPTRSAQQMAATGDPAVAQAQGAATARTLLAAGVNADLAPVVDVARPGSQMEDERRAFGSDAASVTRYSTAFVRGLTAGGVIATAKHFPGFGAAGANTDDARVRIRLSLGELRRVDRVPFVAAVRAGARMVMTSSAIYPALDRRPALLSRRVVTGELRDAAGFDGVAVTDALDTVALGPYRDVAVRAAAAGNDLLSYASSYAAAARAADALAGALRSGRLGRGAARASLSRILALRHGAKE